MTPHWRRTAALCASSILAVTALTATVTPTQAAERSRPSTAPVTDRFAAPPLTWGACDPDDFPTRAADGSSIVPPTYQCADYQVPLDYDRPRGEQISLALIRRPADDPAARQGTIFVNPGGPGGSGVEAVAYAGDTLFGDEVFAAFDIVGFDPRGIAGSTPLQCYPDNAAVIDDLTTNELQVPWPVTDEEYVAARHDTRDIARDCDRTAGPIIDHMGTTNVARDLDVLRRAVGDQQVNFIGYSYGTYICAQYIAQYPKRVGAMVCDANIDPVEYATGEPPWQGFTVPNFARARTEVGANASLEEFFRLCEAGGPENCAFAPDSRARFYALYDTLSDTPLDLGGPVGFDERSLVSSALGPLYDSLFGYPFLAQFLAEIELLAAGGVPEPVTPPEPVVAEPVNEAYLNLEGFYGVSCSDNLQPSAFRAYRTAIENSEGLFGPAWASGDFPCAKWPGTDRDTYFGPFRQRTANPVLVVNTLFDPATPYEDAVDFQRRLPNSALLTVEGWGHVGQGLSACGDAIIDYYMLTRTIPTGSTSCAQDVTPFDPAIFAPSPVETATDPSASATEPAQPGLLDTAVDAALAELAVSGDTAAATDAAAEVVIEELADRGQDELADAVRARHVILGEARPAVLDRRTD